MHAVLVRGVVRDEDEGGAALGAQAGPARLTGAFREAGFADARVAVATAYNLVGFQTRMNHESQKRVLRMMTSESWFTWEAAARSSSAPVGMKP